ncbi:MAG: helix-turn-helix transcriptional regulator [Comamonadaceae bacterium]|nr:MAG: helix-turn-helix transcriptional regulator [Comamonadaceae bacterium]
MDLSEQSFHALIDRIYEAAEEPQRWRTLYAELQEALGVKSIHMLALDKRHQTLSYSDGANLPVQGELAYMQHFRHIDPRLPVILQRPLGEWTHCHEILTEAEVQAHPFYQEFLIPYDRRYMSGCKLVDTDAATVLFVTLTGAAEGPLAEAPRAFLERLLPHLRRACRISLQNFVYSTQALVGHMLVNKLRQPVLLTGMNGEVMHANEAAQELLRSTQLVAVEDGQLRLPARPLQELLRECARMEQAIKAGAAETGGEPAGQFRSLLVADERRSESMYAFYSVLSPQGAMGTFGLRPVVMLLFYHPGSAPAIDGSLLYAVFGLTPAESRIATLLAEGLSLKQIAQAQGTQHDTVRKQLRSIYQKTATNRQPELIRLLLHLPHNALHQ